MLPRSGVVARFPLLSGAVASTVFLVASFSTLAICLVPALRWQYGDTAGTITTAGLGTRSRVLQGEKRSRKRPLKRSASVGHVKLEVCFLCMLKSGLRGRFLTYARITTVAPFHSIQPKPYSMRYAVAVLWYRIRFPKVIDTIPSR